MTSALCPSPSRPPRRRRDLPCATTREPANQAEQDRAERLKSHTIEFIPTVEAEPFTDDSPWDDASQHDVDQVWTTPLLSAEEEAAMFRRMNDLKRRASYLQGKLSAEKPSQTLMDEIEWLLERSDRIRNRLAESYLRLVVSVARGFADAENSLDELVSEGNTTLMRALEKFDAERGFRFSTYATHSVRRNLCRFVSNRRKDRQRITGAETLDTAPDLHKWNLAEERQMADAFSTLCTMLDKLSEREQYIIRSRFGLDRDASVSTLQQLAEHLGVSRERVRQLEQRALSKLRGMAKDGSLDAPCLP